MTLFSMKRVGILIILLMVFFSMCFVIAEDETVNDSRVQRAFDCLEAKVGGGCADTDNIQEIALTILATPDNVYDGCVNKLKANVQNNNLGSVRDTALGILALKHAGEDYSVLETWLLGRAINPKDIIWYLQQDSDSETNCSLKYNSSSYNFNVKKTKKIDSQDLGVCFSPVSSSFWLEINPICYGTNFEVACDKDFITNLLYFDARHKETFYVLDNTEEVGAYGSANIMVKSKCFPSSANSAQCSFEDTAWGAYVLSLLGYDVSSFLPYITAASTENKQFSPNVFLYLLDPLNTEISTQLIKEQNTNGLWWNGVSKYYDTGLVLLALGMNQEQTRRAEDSLWFTQADNGCWANKQLDTAMILWAVERRDGVVDSSEILCEDAGYYCTPESACSVDDDIGSSYFCDGGITTTCCKNPVVNLCSDAGGVECATGKVCSSKEIKTKDSDFCCTTSCVSPETEEEDEDSECILANHRCLSSCDSQYYEPVNYDCDGSKICCKMLPSQDNEEGVPWWIWILVGSIVIVLVVIGIIYKEQIKLLLFKSKSKMDKNPSGNNLNGGIPPRPGQPPFPPSRYGVPPRRPMPPRRSMPPQRPN